MEQQGLNFLVKDNVPRFEWEKKEREKIQV